MNTTTVLEPKAGVDAKTQEKVVKLLTKQLKRVQKYTGFRALFQQIRSYEDKAVFADGTICLQLPAYFTDKHIALNTLTKKRLRMGDKLLIQKRYHIQKQTMYFVQKTNWKKWLNSSMILLKP